MHVSRRSYKKFKENMPKLKDALHSNEFEQNKIYLTSAQCVMITAFEHTQERYVCVTHEKKSPEGVRPDPARTINLSVNEFENLMKRAQEISDIINREEEEEQVEEGEPQDKIRYFGLLEKCERTGRFGFSANFLYEDDAQKALDAIEPDKRSNFKIEEDFITRPIPEEIVNLVIARELYTLAIENDGITHPSIFDRMDTKELADIITAVMKEMKYPEPFNVDGLIHSFTHFGGKYNIFQDYGEGEPALGDDLAYKYTGEFKYTPRDLALAVNAYERLKTGMESKKEMTVD